MSPIAPNRGGNPGEFTGGSGNSSPSAGGAGGSGSGSGSPSVAIAGPGSGAAALIGSEMIPVVRLTPDRTEYGPPIFLGPNDQVNIVPNASNTQPVFVATGGNADAKFPPRVQLAATSNPISVKVRSLREIGVYSTVPGEGVTIVLDRRP
ncbi:MAG TPA: hypothetical protein VFB79_07665 [Candidatus Angelobacter sp.]|nr:hypothetical protein [Candidatus Angelobacter sp.]